MNKLVVALLLLIPQDTLQVKVSLVTVGVRVTDSRGRDVRGLKVQDFALFDDGVEQQIEFFSDEEQPIMLARSASEKVTTVSRSIELSPRPPTSWIVRKAIREASLMG
jgi:hypothetical protein